MNDSTFKLTQIDRRNISRVLDNDKYTQIVRKYIDQGMEINSYLRGTRTDLIWVPTFVETLSKIAEPVKNFFPGKDYITLCRQTSNIYDKGQNQGYASTANICIEEFGKHKNIIFVTKDTPILLYDLTESRHATHDNLPIYEIILPPGQNLIYLGSVDRNTGEYKDENPGYSNYTNFYVTMPPYKEISKKYPSRDDFREFINQYTLSNLKKFMPEIKSYSNPFLLKDLPELEDFVEDGADDRMMQLYKVPEIKRKQKVQNTMITMQQINNLLNSLSSLDLVSLPCPRKEGVYKLRMRGPGDEEEKQIVATERRTIIEASSAFVEGLNGLQQNCPEAERNPVLQQAMALQQIAGQLMTSNVDAVMTIASNPNLSDEMKKFLIEKHYESERGKLEMGQKITSQLLQTVEKSIETQRETSLARTSALRETSLTRTLAEKEVAEKAIKAQQQIASEEIELQAAPGRRQARDKYCYWLISGSISLAVSILTHKMVQKWIVGPLSRASTTLQSVADHPVAMKEAAEYCKEQGNKWIWQKDAGDAFYCSIFPTVGSILSGCKYYIFAGLSWLFNILSEACSDSGLLVAAGIAIVGILFALLLRKVISIKKGAIGITGGALEFDEGYIQPSIGAQTRVSSTMMLPPPSTIKIEEKKEPIRMITEERSVSSSSSSPRASITYESGPQIEEVDEKEPSQSMRKHKMKKLSSKRLSKGKLFGKKL